jgi:hypothetical protein
VVVRLRATFAALLLLGCTTGEGEGWVRSDRLYVADCWNGGFDLQPTFFGANPFREETLIIRVQRGDNIEEVSDGLIAVVHDIQEIRAGSGEQALGLPVGVTPPGVPPTFDPDPPKVSLSLYLHSTCHVQNGTLYSIGGSITFSSLFSGDPNEEDAEDRLTEASFTAQFADPRDLEPDRSIDPERVSTVEGYFRFFFQRGQPAQPFP